MELWIPVTLFAAAIQTLRFGLQRQLRTTQLSSLGATFSRYLYSAPLAVLGFVTYTAATGQAWPTPSTAFWAYLVFGAGMQVLATVCMMALFARRNFSVGIAFSKTTVLMAVPVGWVMLGDTTTFWGLAAILTGFIGVTILSDTPSLTGQGFMRRILTPATGLGLLAGVLFACAGMGYRAALVAMPQPDPVFRALFALACGTVFQTGIMAIWMRVRERGEVSRVFRAWRIAGLVGLTSAIGSTCWFIAFTLQNVAYVNALGQIELLFSLALTVFVFRERITVREVQGGALLTLSILALILLA